MYAIDGADGQQGDLKIKLHHAFNDHPPGTSAATLLGVIPGVIQLLGAADKALPFAGRTHHRLNDARVTNLVHRLQKIAFAVGEAIAGGGQGQLFCGQAANAFPVHGQLRGAGARHHALAFSLQRQQGVGGDGFDFRHYKVRLFCGNHGAQGIAIQHVDDVRAVRNVHGRCIGIAIDGNNFNP